MALLILYIQEYSSLHHFLQVDLALPGSWREAQLLNHMRPSLASPLLSLHIGQELLSTVNQQSQVSLIMVVLVPSVNLKGLGQCSNLCREDGNLDLGAARIRASTRRHGCRIWRNGLRPWFQELVRLVAPKLINEPANIGVEAVLAAAVSQRGDAFQGLYRLGVILLVFFNGFIGRRIAELVADDARHGLAEGKGVFGGFFQLGIGEEVISETRRRRQLMGCLESIAAWVSEYFTEANLASSIKGLEERCRLPQHGVAPCLVSLLLQLLATLEVSVFPLLRLCPLVRILLRLALPLSL